MSARAPPEHQLEKQTEKPTKRAGGLKAVIFSDLNN